MAFYRLQFTILRNTLRALGPFLSLLLVGLAALSFYVIGHLSTPEIVGICAAIVVGIHFNRGDKPLLHLLYHGRQRRLLMVEYAVLSLPFALVCLLNGHLAGAVGCLALSAAVPLIPTITIGLRPLTHPLLPPGAYQYRNTMSILLVPYLVALVTSAVGLLYANPRILHVCFLLTALLVGSMICQPLHRQYLLPYTTPLRIITLQLRYALTSSLVLFLPFIILHLAYAPITATLIGEVKALLLAALFFYLSECVRYLRLGNDLLNMMVINALFVLLLACYMRPIVLPLALLATAGLSANVYQSKKTPWLASHN